MSGPEGVGGTPVRTLGMIATRRRRSWATATALIIGLVVTACAPAPGTPTPPAPPTPPTINNFLALATRSEAPVTATLIWNLTDPNNDPLTCRVDTDGDGTIDRTITNCDTADSVTVTYNTTGPWFPTLEVDDVVTGSATATTQVNVSPGPSESFEISLSLAPTMRPEFRSAFEAAAARWSQVIVAGLPAHQLTVPQDFLGWVPAYDGFVDDVLIAARDYAIDGTYGTLGRATALLTRETGGQAYFGIMEFDTADLDRLATSGRLYSVILHEMGHVLGIGADWALKGFINDLLTNPTYNGPAGVTAWHDLGGTGRVPVEDQGGAGTAIGHWREATFNNELMTGYSDPSERLSRLTVAALADQGYGVNFNAADLYSLPTLPAILGPTSRAADDEEQLVEIPSAPYPENRLPGT
ncbi:MAG: leishmanolysin-related zinc metalloendopeptidase [Actinomycetes bacterium]